MRKRVYDTVQYITAKNTCMGSNVFTKGNALSPVGDGYHQWGWRLEGWPNTAPRLAGRRRVTRQVWFCSWWTGRAGCPDRSFPAGAEGISSCCYLVDVHNHPSRVTLRKEGMAWYSSRLVPSLWILYWCLFLFSLVKTFGRNGKQWLANSVYFSRASRMTCKNYSICQHCVK